MIELFAGLRREAAVRAVYEISTVEITDHFLLKGLKSELFILMPGMEIKCQRISISIHEQSNPPIAVCIRMFLITGIRLPTHESFACSRTDTYGKVHCRLFDFGSSETAPIPVSVSLTFVAL